jgi:hypothetical protein
VLPQAKGSLSLLQPPPRRLLACSLGSPFRLSAKGFARVGDAVLLAVALDPRNAAIRSLREVGLFTHRDDEIVEPTPAAVRAVKLLT